MVDLRSNDNLLNFWCSDTSQNFPSKENSKNNQGQLVVTAQPLKLCVEQKYFPWRLGLKLPKLMVGKRWWYFPTQPKLQGSERGKKICKNIMSWFFHKPWHVRILWRKNKKRIFHGRRYPSWVFLAWPVFFPAKVQNLVENYKKFGKKIWLTEFACADQNYDVYLGENFLARNNGKKVEMVCTSNRSAKG